MGVKKSAEYPSRNRKAGGNTTKYPKAAPPIKHIDERKEKGSRAFFSCL
jgi:hypothetical protein